MRNRYKSDLNRLIEHPRRRQASRNLRSPGALGGTFSAASGLPREPVLGPIPSFIFEPAKYDGVSGTKYLADKVTYGEPFESGGTPINDPLGTVDGTNSAWTVTPDSSSLLIERGKSRNYGNKNWFDGADLVLSWDGPPGRAHRVDQNEFSASNFEKPWRTSPKVYYQQQVIFDLSNESSGSFDEVFGAAVHDDGLGQKWLIVIASDFEFIPLDIRENLSGQSFRAFRVPVDSALQATGPMESLQQYTLPVDMNYQSHFYFSESGGDAVCTIIGDLLDLQNVHIDLLRYNIDTGFSVEQIWTRNQSIGTLTQNESYSVLSDTPVAGQVTTTGSLYRTYQTSSHLIPIYCDFIGDTEVIAYESHAGLNSIREADFNKLQAADISYTATGSLSETYGSPFEVVTSENKVLFQMPYKADRDESISYDSLQNGSGGHFRVNNSETCQVGGIAWEENLLAIDVRFDFCAVTYGGYQYSVTESVDTTYNDPEIQNTGAATATGSVTGNEIVEIVEYWVGGQMKMQEEAQRLTGPITLASYSVDPLPNLGITGSNSNTQTDINPQAPMKIGSKYLLTAAAYQFGPHSIGSVAMNYKTGSTTRKPVLLNHVSGYSDAVADILQRDEADGYMLCSVGLI